MYGGGMEIFMFLHLGGDVVVKSKTIVAIMDLETSSVSKITREFLKKATQNENVININTFELPKSYVICEEKGKITVFVSPISSRTLNKRADSKNILEGLHI